VDSKKIRDTPSKEDPPSQQRSTQQDSVEENFFSLKSKSKCRGPLRKDRWIKLKKMRHKNN
jgi:hypothetical protein